MQMTENRCEPEFGRSKVQGHHDQYTKKTFQEKLRFMTSILGFSLSMTVRAISHQR